MKNPARQKPEKIRVGFICDLLEIGGQERACYRLLQHLDRSRFAPYLYAFRPGRMLDDFCALQVPLHLGHSRPGLDTTWDDTDRRARTAWRRRLTQLLQDDAIDVVIIFSWRDGPAAARAAGVRTIIERVDGPALSGRIGDKTGLTRVVCESPSACRLLLSQCKRFGLSREQVRMAQNGLDRTLFSPARYSRKRCRKALGIADDEFIIGATARLVPVKNLGVLLRAIALLPRLNLNARRSKLRLVVVGPDGGEHRALSGLARELGIRNLVTFLGPRKDIPEILRAFDVFVSTSLVEGTPNALLEAMAMALPVIATPVGGVPELIDRSNLVSPHANRVLAKKLLKLWQEPIRRKQLGRQNRRKSAQFDIVQTVRQFEQIIIDAIRVGRKGPALARRLVLISPAKGSSRKLRRIGEQLKNENVDVRFIRLRDNALEDHRVLQNLRLNSDPDLALVGDLETASYVRSELWHIEIVLILKDHDRLPRSPNKYTALDHILFCSADSVVAVQKAFPFLIDKILPGCLIPDKKPISVQIASLLEMRRNRPSSEKT